MLVPFDCRAEVPRPLVITALEALEDLLRGMLDDFPQLPSSNALRREWSIALGQYGASLVPLCSR